MTAPCPPLRVHVDDDTARLLRLYRGERPAAVIARAVRMLATADGRLDTAGRIKQRGTP
ncbi:hypothetical protein [Streptomyces mesophilus]|uniref:hypothetical protein n=1 Tax=Streptomyces mesophilus TaxID=1775132 RepID=UPI003326FF33